tara:strand:+ start:8198 stop:9877 length:1680 start_codon:yes stop_codon:yes gene_type:complete
MSKINEEKTYADKVNSAGLKFAMSLLKSGEIDYKSDWSFDAGDGNKMLGADGDNWDEYSKYHLGINSDAEPDTKAYYAFPFGKDGRVYASAIRAIRSRAGQNKDTEILEASAPMMELIQEKESDMAEDKKIDEDALEATPQEDEQGYEAEDVFETSEEAEVRAKEMGGKGHHEMTIKVEEKEETRFMPFDTHEEYLTAKEKIKAEMEKEPEQEVEVEDKVKIKENAISQTFNLDGIEIFSTGVWNGDKYTTKDLEAMVSNFDKTGFQPPLKLGHNEEQPEMKDGEPSLGYVDKIYQEGSKLLANFKELPKKVYEAIKRGNYKRVSSEIYWNYKSNNQVLDRVLKAVALLGTEIPAITNLEAIEGLYVKATGEGIVKKHYQEKESELMIESEQGKGISFKEYQNLQDKLKTLEADKTKAIEQLEESKKEQKAAEISKFIQENKESGKILPVFEKELEVLMQSATEKKVYSYTEEEKTVELSQFELVEKIVKSFPKMVEFEEISTEGDYVVDRQPYTKAGDEIDRRAKLFISKGKAKKYSEALELVLKEDKQLRDEYYENQ